MFSNQNYSFNVSDDREWNDIPAGKETLSPTGFIVLSVFLGLIMTFGFLNNFVVLLLFCKFKTLRTPVNMLLLNISVSDMFVCLFGTTLSFASSIRGRWLLGRLGCSWYGFINSCFGKFLTHRSHIYYLRIQLQLCSEKWHHLTRGTGPKRQKTKKNLLIYSW